jgi:hypothetical protein
MSKLRLLDGSVTTTGTSTRYLAGAVLSQIFTSTVPFNVVPLPKQDTVTSPTPSVYLVRDSPNSTEETQNTLKFF